MIEFDEFFELISDFMNRELEAQLMEEFNRSLEEEFFREFFNTFRKTVELCHCMECCEPPEEVHITLIRMIRQTPQIKPAAKKPKPRRNR